MNDSSKPAAPPSAPLPPAALPADGDAAGDVSVDEGLVMDIAVKWWDNDDTALSNIKGAVREAILAGRHQGQRQMRQRARDAAMACETAAKLREDLALAEEIADAIYALPVR